MSDEIERELAEDIAEFVFDPYGFAMYAFPWGEPGPLEDYPDGPDEWQRNVLDGIATEFDKDPEATVQDATASGHGIGKMQRYSDMIPTPDGMARWGDLKPGQSVFGVDGRPAKILQTKHFQKVPMYRVTFDDGSSLDVSSGHLWSVRGRQERRNKKTIWRTMETIEILSAGVKRPNGKAEARQWEIPIQAPAKFNERDTPLPPYFMGVWLGDGSAGTARYTKPDPEVRARLERCGLSVSGDGVSNYVRSIKSRLTDQVFKLNSSDRYIPDDYKFNSIHRRMELFSGLCDTDGEVHASGSIGYSTTSKKLANDMLWLARSLGCKAMFHPSVKRGRYKDSDGNMIECKDCYRLTINAHFNPFTIERKRNQYKPSEARYIKRWIDSIEPIEPADGMCITVDRPDGLYQSCDFVVTHNSALTAIIILWAMSTRPHLNGIITANTTTQLSTKTWRELSVWHKRAINKHWFTWTATKFFHNEHPETWFTAAVPNSEHNSEAFAGQHAKHVLVIYDEASGIPDIIWEVSEGAMTTPGAMWFVFGNPTRNTGRFRECFSRYRHRWNTRQVDSRTAKMTDKVKISEWLEDYGEDSDFFRVRVRGEFPRISDTQFISEGVVAAAQERKLESQEFGQYPKIMGVDVARFGNDQSVITLRQGPKVHYQYAYRGLDTVEVAIKVRDLYAEDRDIVAICVDGPGVGGGVVDQLKQFKLPVVDVQPAGRSPSPDEFLNMRAWLWGQAKIWLQTADLPAGDRELLDDYTGIEYGYDKRLRIQMESKQDMKKRGQPSPDKADSLNLTFHPIDNVIRPALEQLQRAQARSRPRRNWRGYS